MLLRTLRGPEVNCITNERDVFAIVWALRKLKDYLYGVNNQNIYTGHQPVTYTVSENTRMPK